MRLLTLSAPLLCLTVAAADCAQPRRPSSGSAMREPPSVDSGHVAVPGGALYYEAAGRGAPVVLLHPSFMDRRVWDAQFVALARTHRVIRIDARGFGRSTPVRDTVHHVADLDALLQALEVGPATLVGNSLGGGTAIDFALAHPDRVRGLVLVGAGLGGYAWPEESEQEPWRVVGRAALARGDTAGVARAWLRSDYLAASVRQPAVAAKLDTLLAENVAYWKGLLRDGDLDPGPDPRAIARLGEIRVPTLIVVGAADTRDMHRIADTLRTRIAGARLIVMPRVGHVPSLERPGEFTRLLQQFLAEAQRATVQAR